MIARTWLGVVVLLLLPLRALGHVGSPDVFFEGDAGPYRLFVTIRTPEVIPGIATIEIRSESPDVSDITVVPMRLTGPGSKLPPTSDHADRSSTDRQFFTASLWLMERGSLQVRVGVTGARGPGQVAVPVPAVAQRTLAMTSSLGGLLFGLMLVLALAIIGIIVGAVREATLPPGAPSRARPRLATAVVTAAVIAAIALGKLWWNGEAANYAQLVMQPWHVTPRISGCMLTVPANVRDVLPDHGHDMHLFLVRVPDFDRLVHVHPQRQGTGDFAQTLPSLPAGRYQLFADIVLPSGFPITGTAVVDLPDLSCPTLAGDDTAWASGDELAGGAHMIWDRPPQLRAGVAQALKFRVVAADGTGAPLEPYMGMAGHAEVIRRDATVFAHLHPSGSVAMPALELAMPMPMAMTTAMPDASHHEAISSDLAFPYGFPKPGDYRIFIQIKRGGVIETATFDAHVD